MPLVINLSFFLFQAPFIPYLTEHMYQNLKHLMGEEYTKCEETQSVHYLMLPEARYLLMFVVF